MHTNVCTTLWNYKYMQVFAKEHIVWSFQKCIMCRMILQYNVCGWYYAKSSFVPNHAIHGFKGSGYRPVRASIRGADSPGIRSLTANQESPRAVFTRGNAAARVVRSLHWMSRHLLLAPVFTLELCMYIHTYIHTYIRTYVHQSSYIVSS